jgi:hypothetical protein
MIAASVRNVLTTGALACRDTIRMPSYAELRQMRVTVREMGRLTIAGLIAVLTLGSFVVVASAQVTPPPPAPPRAPFWPATTGAPVVAEWYSDVPWHQKLVRYFCGQRTR